MRRKVRGTRWSNCGLRCRTRCVSSTRCATHRSPPSRPTSRSKRPCARNCSPRSERYASSSSSRSPRHRRRRARQLAVLDEYASGMLTAFNTDGVQPFKYAAVEAADMLDEVEASLQQLEKKGGL